MNVENIFDMLISLDYPIDGAWTVDQLTGVIIESGMDITQFTAEEISQLIQMCDDTQHGIINMEGDILLRDDLGKNRISFGGYYNADDSYHYTSYGVDGDPSA